MTKQIYDVLAKETKDNCDKSAYKIYAKELNLECKQS